MSFSDRLLSCEDDEFVLKVDKDIREFLENSPKNRQVKVKFLSSLDSYCFVICNCKRVDGVL